MGAQARRRSGRGLRHLARALTTRCGSTPTRPTQALAQPDRKVLLVLRGLRDPQALWALLVPTRPCLVLPARIRPCLVLPAQRVQLVRLVRKVHKVLRVIQVQPVLPALKVPRETRAHLAQLARKDPPVRRDPPVQTA